MGKKKPNINRCGNEVLRLVKHHLPEVYSRHVARDGIDAFIERFAVIEDEGFAGEVVGKVPKDLKLLWALNGAFKQYCHDFTRPCITVHNTVDVCEVIQNRAFFSLFEIGTTLFWLILFKRYASNGFCLAIRPDWTVVKIPFNMMKPDFLEVAGMLGPVALLETMICQMTILQATFLIRKAASKGEDDPVSKLLEQMKIK